MTFIFYDFMYSNGNEGAFFFFWPVIYVPLPFYTSVYISTSRKLEKKSQRIYSLALGDFFLYIQYNAYHMY
jgi:hypothetical protein